MGLRFPDQKHCSCFFVTTTFRDWQPYGQVSGMYQALADSLNHYIDVYQAQIAGYTLMPTHLHFMIFIDGKYLGSFMRDFKKYLAQKAAKDLGIRTNHLWMPRYDRVAITLEEVLRTKLDYIHNNALKAGYVDAPKEWRWSSARDYAEGINGPVKIWKGWA